MIIPVSLSILILTLTSAHSSGLQDITPVPKEHFDPRVSEFLRIDSNADQQITFAEFILGDTEYIREQSKNFHRFDTNADNVITKAEYDAYFKNHEGTRMGGRRGEHDDFMRRMQYDSPRERRSLQVDGYYSSHHEIAHSGRIPLVNDHVVVYNYDPSLGMTRIYPVNSNGVPQFGSASNGGIAWNTNALSNPVQNSLPNSGQNNAVSVASGSGSPADSSSPSGGGTNSLSDIASLVQKIPGASAIPGFSTIQSLASLTNFDSRTDSLFFIAHAPHPSHSRDFFEPSRLRPDFPEENPRFGKEDRRGGPRFTENTPRYPPKEDDSSEEITLLPSPPTENREEERQGERQGEDRFKN